MSALFPWAAPTPLPKSRTSPITEGGSSLQWQHDKDRTQSAGMENTIMHSLEKLYHSTMHGRNQLTMRAFHSCLIIPEWKGRGGKKTHLVYHCLKKVTRKWKSTEYQGSVLGVYSIWDTPPFFLLLFFPLKKKKSLAVLRRHLSKSHFLSG